VSWIAIASIVATANNMRYGSANTDAPLGGGAGVEGFDTAGLDARTESVAESTGEGRVRDVDSDGMVAGSARGANNVGFDGDKCSISLDVERAGVFGAEAGGPLPTSTLTAVSRPFSTTTYLVSAGPSGPKTPGRSSYNMGENLTATLAFLCPGS
jgi:hypothetical protein